MKNLALNFLDFSFNQRWYFDPVDVVLSEYVDFIEITDSFCPG